MQTKSEVWVDCAVTDTWQVSNLGRVRNKHNLYIRKLVQNPSGYLYVCHSQTGKNYLVSRLVAQSFLGKSDLQVNHKDGNKQNNCLENLEFVTASGNALHRFYVLGKNNLKPMFGNENPMRKHGSPFIGSKHPKSKLTEENVRDIRKRINDGIDGKETQKLYNISPQLFYSIKKNKIWTHVSL